MRYIYLFIVFVLLLQGCGHKGPLYLPQKPQPNAEKPSGQAPAQQQEKQS